MTVDKKQETRVKVKRIQIRGDEVAILFFSLVCLAFLFISFFRLTAAGKLFDDFLFTFLFGWTKYLVYAFLFIILLPIFFNFYFRIKVSFVIGTFFTLFALSWFVQNISIIVNSKNNVPWNHLYFYKFGDLSNYFDTWWNATIINNYYGFFAQPISFGDWTNVTSFFPTFASGGIVANFLVYATAFGGFVTGLCFSSVLLFVGISWVIFAKPWLLLLMFFFFLLPGIKIIKKQRINRISEKSLKHKTQLDQQEEIFKPTFAAVKQELPKVEPEPQPVKTVTRKKEPSREIILQDVIQESGTLSPFGQINQKQEKKEDKKDN